MYVDATFSIVPHPFYQCLIIMIWEPTLSIYVPVAWILMTGKTDECYWQAFNWLSNVVDNLMPEFIGVDFEIAFFSQIKNHFEESDLIGCLFHFKQAMRRKMVKLGIPEAELKFAMRKGIVDLITVIPLDDLDKGIVFIRHMIAEFVVEQGYSDGEERASHERWDAFWDQYFIP